MLKKHCYLCSQPHCYQALLLILLTMLIRVQVKLLLKVKLSMHLVLLLGDEDQTINLGEVADTVLKAVEITACRCHHSFAGLYFI